MANLRRSRFNSRGPRRQVTWISPADQGYLAVGANAKVLMASFDPVATGMEKPTIIRNRGELSVRPTSFASDAGIVGAYGMAIVSDQAAAIGITAIPGPFTEAEWDGWLVWHSFSMFLEFGDATGRFMADRAIIVDSKGMRKISDNETLVVVAESQSGAFSISAPIRTLFKLA